MFDPRKEAERLVDGMPFIVRVFHNEEEVGRMKSARIDYIAVALSRVRREARHEAFFDCAKICADVGEQALAGEVAQYLREKAARALAEAEKSVEGGK